MSRLQRLVTGVAVTIVAMAGAPLAAAAQEHGTHGTGPGEIPASLRAEHAEIHDALERATRARGRTGAAARALAALLHPHFVREEQIALPPLGLLRPLSQGDWKPEMQRILPLTDSLRAELPKMLDEHKAIRAATQRMGAAARAEHNTKVAALAEQLALHAQSEEEMFYPAAVLVGDIVRARAPKVGP